MLNTICLSIFAIAGTISIAAIAFTIRECAPALRRLFDGSI